MKKYVIHAIILLYFFTYAISKKQPAQTISNVWVCHIFCESIFSKSTSGMKLSKPWNYFKNLARKTYAFFAKNSLFRWPKDFYCFDIFVSINVFFRIQSEGLFTSPDSFANRMILQVARIFLLKKPRKILL